MSDDLMERLEACEANLLRRQAAASTGCEASDAGTPATSPERPKEAFTPGPWQYRPDKYDDWGVVKAPERFVICQARDRNAMDDDCLNQHRRAGSDPWEANARLIAAAPELYEALDHLVKVIHSAALNRGFYLEELLHDSPHFMGKQGYKFAMDALAKARGEVS